MAAGGPVRRLYGVLRVTRRRVREAAPYKGGRCLDGGGGKPPPYMGSPPWDGRPSVPPLRCAKTIPPIRRGRTLSRAAGCPAIPAPTLIRPLRGHLPPGRGKAFGRPHGAAPTKGGEPCPLICHGFSVPPFPIPSVASRHLPLTRGVGPQGEGLRATARVAPTAGTGSATLVRSRQAQVWNCVGCNFCILRAPAGPDGTAEGHSIFARRK